MKHGFSDPYARGLGFSALGMFILSPDGLMLRLIGEAGPWDIIFYRSLFMGLSLLAVMAVLYRGRFFAVWRAMFKDQDRRGLISVALMTGSNLAFIGAITHTTIANTLVILAAMPLFSAILGWLLIGEPVRRRTRMAIVAAFAGMVAILIDSIGGGTWMGDGLAAVCALFMALNLVHLRKGGGRNIMPALCLSGFLSAGVALLFARPMAVTGHDLGVLAALGLVIVPAAMTLFFSGTKSVPAAEVALLSLIETVFGSLWVWLGVGEAPAALALLGGLIVIGAVGANALVAIRNRKRLAQPP